MSLWITPSGFIGTFTERVSTSTSVVASGTNVIYRILSGSLPDGIKLSTTGTISGTPAPVLNTENYKFVVRATSDSAIADRTFNLDIFGPSAPEWFLTNTTESTSTRLVNGSTQTTVTPFLNVGLYNRPYGLNKQYVKFQLLANSINSPDGTKIQYYIADGSGRLPPGLSLSSTGTITGIINDKLTFDGNLSEYGGYDTESYDTYTYDHSDTTATQITGIPKLYRFKVTADDGIISSTQTFGLLVVNPNMFRVDNTQLVYNTATFYNIPTPLTADLSSLQALQFIEGSNLGTVKSAGNYVKDISAYDPQPENGTTVYSITSSNNYLNMLPRGLGINSNGIVRGFIPYQPAYAKTYTFEVNATKTNTLRFQTTASNVFSLTVSGNVSSYIKWVSTGTLGSIFEGFVSELSVKAEQINSENSIKYELLSGSLPSGLTLQQDGSISGSPSYGSTGTYTFTVLASDVYGLSAIDQEFTIEVNQYRQKQYTQIYAKPFLSLELRKQFQTFMSDTFTFDPAFIYRYNDPNFGVQQQIKMYLEFGIEKIKLGDYYSALMENFYRKRLYFGDVKIAYAADEKGVPVYELIYLDIIDDQINSKNQTPDNIFYSNNYQNAYYPSSIKLMRKKLRSIVLPNHSYIGTNLDSLPRFMGTPQPGSYKPPGYMRVVPLCYALPGYGSKILSRIKLTEFDFKILDFEIDRLIVQESLDSASAKYLMFSRQAITDKLPTDDILFGPDTYTGTNYIDLVELDIETGEPLTRV